MFLEPCVEDVPECSELELSLAAVCLSLVCGELAKLVDEIESRAGMTAADCAVSCLQPLVGVAGVTGRRIKSSLEAELELILRPPTCLSVLATSFVLLSLALFGWPDLSSNIGSNTGGMSVVGDATVGLVFMAVGWLFWQC